MKDIKNLLLLLFSIGLVCTWVYHIYDKTVYSQRRTEVYIKDSAAVADAIKDSLNKIYAATITDLDTRLNYAKVNTDSLQGRLETKLGEINRLRSEIDGILNKQGLSKNDLGSARQKIDELQQKVEALRDQNMSMEEEKEHLQKVLTQLTQDADTLQQNMRRLSAENEILNEKINLASIFIASELKIDAVKVRGSSEHITTQAKKTDKFVASFIIQNHVSQVNNAELTTVLFQPDGQVLQDPVWESGLFDTKNEGKKPFTRKIKFDYEKGEQKNLLFTIDTEKCQKGTYIFQVWHNGTMIGQVTKTLG